MALYTDHMNSLTILMVISLSTVKKSAMTRPCSPICPRMMPKTIAKPMIPARDRNHQDSVAVVREELQPCENVAWRR